MPKQYYKPGIRERLIRKLKSMGSQGYLFERTLLRQLGGRERPQIAEELSSLLSEGFVHRLGTGRRGDPFRLILSGTWPFNKCPLCGHTEYPAPPARPPVQS